MAALALAVASGCGTVPAATHTVDAGDAGMVRPVNSSYMLGVGSSHIADTYLSPLKYTGWHTDFHYERMQAMKFSPLRWRQQLTIGAEIDRGQNPVKNSTLLYGTLSASWGMMHRWDVAQDVAVAFGGSAGAHLGAIYNARNSNNPAAAKADITVNATAYATWHITLGRMPVMLRWQTSMPLTGVFFSPEYDELYYEIYLGNHHGLVHGAWPGNYFRWNNLLTADLDFANTRLRLGFRSDILSSEVNHITTRIFSYAFVLGVSGDWFSVSPRKGLPSGAMKVIYAY